MKAEQLQHLIRTQRDWFAAGNTLPVESRLEALRSLRTALKAHEAELYEALRLDLGKSEGESYMCELGMVLSELNFMLSHTKSYAREHTVPTPLAQFAARSFVKPSPRGVCLIMSPWNYPLMLALDPLIDCIAAGNTAILKPSAYAPATCAVLQTIVSEAFEPHLVALVTGGRAENEQLLHQEFDYIFFTGSQNVGREVLRCAAEHLTPVSLELGGKSPCIVDRTADLKLAARRIVFGKYLNCGQTCVAPDYLCVEEGVCRPLLEAIRAEIVRQFGEHPLENPAYGKIINEKHFARLCGLLEQENVIFGGETQPQSLRMAPAIVSPCTWESPVMQEEIFGPILPVLTFSDLGALCAELNRRPHPLALYFFSRDKAAIRRVTSRCAFGGGCINDTIIHLATTHMGFGGVGASGMGAYHGKVGFDAFSHRKSIVDKKLWLDLPMRYQPYTDFSRKLVRLFLR